MNVEMQAMFKTRRPARLIAKSSNSRIKVMPANKTQTIVLTDFISPHHYIVTERVLRSRKIACLSKEYNAPNFCGACVHWFWQLKFYVPMVIREVPLKGFKMKTTYVQNLMRRAHK